MGINTFSFDGVSSDTYGVYITEGASYNAPERAVEMLEIPGRNGHFALDQGRFENVEVTYHVFIDGSSETDYSANLSDLRNWLCSKVGYARLTDSYNPNEYRMAVYKSGLEVDATSIQSGEFDVVFDCKPQRWLTSGETATAVADGGTLSNPTLFESEPLLAVKGYGNINFNGYDIDIENSVIGNITLIESISNSGSTSIAQTFQGSLLSNGDTIKVGGIKFKLQIYRTNANTYATPTITNSNAAFSTTTEKNGINPNIQRFLFTVTSSSATFYYGTSSTVTNTVSGSNSDLTISFKTNIQYNSTNDSITLSISDISLSGTWAYTSGFGGIQESASPITAYSTVSTLGNPTYIDCEIGECYMYDGGGDIISLNGVIDLGSDLPKLVSGTNTINYDNTITSLEVTPRWWKV